MFWHYLYFELLLLLYFELLLTLLTLYSNLLSLTMSVPVTQLKVEEAHKLGGQNCS